MSGESSYLKEQYLVRLEELTAVLSSGDDAQIDQLVSEITTLRESSLYQELGRLTREIHDAINSFADDERIVEMAEERIPDAKERLSFIVTKTDEAAHRTMTGAEDTMALVDDFSGRAQSMRKRWQQFTNRELSKDEFVLLSTDLEQFLESIDDESQAINGKMTEIMLAQDYQDITGQMIKQVVKMVQEIEDKLVRLVSISGASPSVSAPTPKPRAEVAEGPQLPDVASDEVAHSQGDVDDLLASLGF